MHLLILKCTGFSGRCVGQAMGEHGARTHWCCTRMQAVSKTPWLGASLLPSTHDLPKFSAKHSYVSQHFTMCFQNETLCFLLWDNQKKPPYPATRGFPVPSLCHCCSILQSENQLSCLSRSGMKWVAQRGDGGFLQDHEVLGVVLSILSTMHQLLNCFLSQSGS